jgi:hypothetical protein
VLGGAALSGAALGDDAAVVSAFDPTNAAALAKAAMLEDEFAVVFATASETFVTVSAAFLIESKIPILSSLILNIDVF